MKILFSELEQLSVDLLIINSLDQSLYQALVKIDGIEHPVWENSTTPLSYRSLTAIRKRFSELAIHKTLLRQDSSYDEMIGQPGSANHNRLQVPLGPTHSL